MLRKAALSNAAPPERQDGLTVAMEIAQKVDYLAEGGKFAQCFHAHVGQNYSIPQHGRRCLHRHLDMDGLSRIRLQRALGLAITSDRVTKCAPTNKMNGYRPSRADIPIAAIFTLAWFWSRQFWYRPDSFK